MRILSCRSSLLVVWLTLTLLLTGCAGQKCLVVLLPEAGKVSGEVTVVTANGSQVLNQSWQATQIAGGEAKPASPVLMNERAVREIFGEVLAAMPRPAVHYLLYFQLDSTELMSDSQLLLPEILKSINERSPAELSVIGHTDTVGSDEYNYQLGFMRASAVSDRLKSLGASPIRVQISSMGERYLLVNTGDQILEPRNRRAEVTVR